VPFGSLSWGVHVSHLALSSLHSGHYYIIPYVGRERRRNCRPVPYLPPYKGFPFSQGNDDERPNENQAHFTSHLREVSNLPISRVSLVPRCASSPSNPQPPLQQGSQPFNIRIHLQLYLRMDPGICIFDHGP